MKNIITVKTHQDFAPRYNCQESEVYPLYQVWMINTVIYELEDAATLQDNVTKMKNYIGLCKVDSNKGNANHQSSLRYIYKSKANKLALFSY